MITIKAAIMAATVCAGAVGMLVPDRRGVVAQDQAHDHASIQTRQAPPSAIAPQQHGVSPSHMDLGRLAHAFR